MKFNVKVLEVWAQWLVYMATGAIIGIGKFPLDMTAHDWKNVANVIWGAAIPVIVKWANPKDPLTFINKVKKG